ncbi:MAG: hypothetical protein ACK5ND_04750 [Bacteroides sp.]
MIGFYPKDGFVVVCDADGRSVIRSQWVGQQQEVTRQEFYGLLRARAFFILFSDR